MRVRGTLEFSDDGGRTWQSSARVLSVTAELPNGRVVAFGGENLAAELERLKAVESWQQEGEAILERGRSASALFWLGSWWADRPWRARP